MTNSNILAIIPARGESKGIHRKNIQPISGKLMLVYSIEHALQTPFVSRVVVSTDDAEIAVVAQQYGAEVVWRPSEISNYTASSESALLHTLNYLRDTEGYEPDLVVFLQATSPLRRHNDIQNAIKTLQNNEADSLFSACFLQGFVWRREGEKLLSLTYDYHHRQRRQDAPKDLIENGSIYVFKPWVLRKFNNRLGGKIAVYLMNVLDSFQIDETADLELIEQLLTIRRPVSGLSDLANIDLLVLDFDGVMTDNRVHVDQEGRESVWCHRGDGWGIARLKEAGVEVVVLSTEANPVVTARSKKLGVECIHGCNDKISALHKLARERAITSENIAFVGNDVNDLVCMRWVGFPIAVADAEIEIKKISRLLTTRHGGRGAVREIANWILEAKGYKT